MNEDIASRFKIRMIKCSKVLSIFFYVRSTSNLTWPFFQRKNGETYSVAGFPALSIPADDMLQIHFAKGVTCRDLLKWFLSIDAGLDISFPSYFERLLSFIFQVSYKSDIDFFILEHWPYAYYHSSSHQRSQDRYFPASSIFASYRSQNGPFHDWCSTEGQWPPRNTHTNI